MYQETLHTQREGSKLLLPFINAYETSTEQVCVGLTVLNLFAFMATERAGNIHNTRALIRVSRRTRVRRMLVFAGDFGKFTKLGANKWESLFI